MALPKVGMQAVLEGAQKYIDDLNKAAAAEQKAAAAAAQAASDTKRMATEQEAAAKKTQALNSALTKIGLAFSATFAVGVGLAVKSAADFEFKIDQVGAVAGATGEEIGQLSGVAKKLGADTAFSAGQAADAMQELAAGGRSVAQIVGGEAKAAVDLAAAGNYGLADSARTIATAMSIWEGTTLSTTDVVNRLAGAANSSRFGVDDMAQAIAQGGGAAATAGVSFQDFSTAVAATASNFSSGSDAGTSFKTFVLQLTPASDKARQAIEDLGLKFFDATGKIRPMSEVVQELHDKIGPLTQEQQTLALKTIFGNDAFRTAAGLMKLTGDEFAAMSQKMGSTDAAEVAAQRMGNFRGTLEQLKGSLETLAISFGEKVIPVLNNLVGWATKIINAFGALPDSTQKVVLLGGAFVALLPIVAKVFSPVKGLIGLITNLGTASTKAKLALGAGGLAAAITILDTVIASLTGKGIFERVIDFFSGGASTAEKASGRFKEFGAETQFVAEKTQVLDLATRNIKTAQDEMNKSIDETVFWYTKGGEAVTGQTLKVVGLTNSQYDLVKAQDDLIDAQKRGDSNGQAFVEMLNKARVEVQAMGMAMRENGASTDQIIAQWDSLNPLLREAFQNGVNWNSVLIEMTARGAANAQGMADLDEAMAGLNSVVEKQVQILPRAKGAIESWAEAVSLTADGVVDLDKKIQALTQRFADQNPVVASLNAKNAILQEELDDLAISGETYSMKLGLTTDEIKAQIAQNDKLKGTYESNQTAVEGLTQALTMALGEEGFAGLMGAMADAGVQAEDQIDVMGKVSGAYDSLSSNAIPAALSSFGELKGQLAPEVWAPLAKAIGPDLVAAINDGVSDPAQKALLIQQVQLLIGGAITAAEMTASEASRLGDMMVTGMAQGIDGSSYKLDAAARSVVQAAYNAARSEAEARSPSKLFEEGVGIPIGEGIAVGIEDSDPIVVHSLGELFDALVTAMREGADTIGQSTVMVLDNLKKILQQGLDEGTALSSKQILEMFDAMIFTMKTANLPDAIQTEIGATIDTMIRGLAEGKGLANQAGIDLIEALIDGIVSKEAALAAEAATVARIAAASSGNPGNAATVSTNAAGQNVYRNRSGALVTAPASWRPAGMYTAAQLYQMGFAESTANAYAGKIPNTWKFDPAASGGESSVDEFNKNVAAGYKGDEGYVHNLPGYKYEGNGWFSPLARGMRFVPYDGFLAMLHRGERVLTAAESRQWSPSLSGLAGIAAAPGASSPAIPNITIDLAGSTFGGSPRENAAEIGNVVRRIVRDEFGRDARLYGVGSR